MTKQIDTEAFKVELEALCLRYGVHLTTDGHDLIQIYRPHPTDDGPVNWAEDWDCVRKD